MQGLLPKPPRLGRAAAAAAAALAAGARSRGRGAADARDARISGSAAPVIHGSVDLPDGF